MAIVIPPFMFSEPLFLLTKLRYSGTFLVPPFTNRFSRRRKYSNSVLYAPHLIYRFANTAHYDPPFLFRIPSRRAQLAGTFPFFPPLFFGFSGTFNGISSILLIQLSRQKFPFFPFSYIKKNFVTWSPVARRSCFLQQLLTNRTSEACLDSPLFLKEGCFL